MFLVHQILKSKLLIPVLVYALSTEVLLGQNNKKGVHTIAFYNVENLFDTSDDPHVNDNEFLPDGSKKWTKDRYKQKLDRLASVIQQLGDTDGPEILGLCEVENLSVVQDLVNHERLKSFNYSIIHYDSPDPRGIDVALIYKKGIVSVDSSSVYPVKTSDREGSGSRDILAVFAKFKNGIPAIFLVNHWPSRVGGVEKTRPKRMIASNSLLSVLEALKSLNSSSMLFIMGDFNDDPTDSSILNITNNPELQTSTISNPSSIIWNVDSIGTLEYRGKWNMFDQIMYSIPATKQFKKVQIGGFNIFNPEWVKEQKTNSPSKPWRTFSGQKYTGGYSDHFPVYIHVRF